MTKRKEPWSTKHYKENKILSNTNPIKAVDDPMLLENNRS